MTERELANAALDKCKAELKRLGIDAMTYSYEDGQVFRVMAFDPRNPDDFNAPSPAVRSYSPIGIQDLAAALAECATVEDAFYNLRHYRLT
jgi:hypothetical protein